MGTFYIGYRDVLRGRSDTANTYTGLVGIYSNWDLMYNQQVLEGAPDNQRTPGVGLYNWGPPGTKWGGEGDVLLSGLFTGAQQALGFYASYRGNLVNPQNAINPSTVSAYPGGPVGYFYGNFPLYQYFGLVTSYSGEDGTIDGHRPIVNGSSYGHLAYSPNLPLDTNGDPIGLGPESPYREWDRYYHGLANNEAMATDKLGHVAHFTASYTDQSGIPSDDEIYSSYNQAASFGSFQPYIYKGVNQALAGAGPAWGGEIEMGLETPGHVYYAAGSVGTSNDHYGDEHVREWFGVASSQALNGGIPANGSNSYPTLPPKL